jgi:hypothetical protein
MPHPSRTDDSTFTGTRKERGMENMESAVRDAGGKPARRVDRKLMIASLLGSMHGQHEDAELASAAVESLLANPARYRLYRAIAKGMGGDAGFAAQMLEQQPEDDREKVALATALMLAGNAEWRTVIDRVLALSTDQAARTAATRLIDFMEGFGRRRSGG